MVGLHLWSIFIGQNMDLTSGLECIFRASYVPARCRVVDKQRHPHTIIRNQGDNMSKNDGGGGAWISVGATAAAAKYVFALFQFCKLKAKLEDLECWTGNAYESIKKAYDQGLISGDQCARWHEVRKAANDARH